VGEALDMMQLSGKADRRPAQLSGGEQQRVALARALVNRPSVVLLDEPLGALDQQLRQDMQVELKAIQARVGLTFIYVTHHQEEALTMSHRVAVMDRGRILQIGSPQDVYERPASTFVARFIGLSNMLRGRVTEAGETRCTVSAADLPALSVHHAVPDVKPGVDVAVVVRPERVRVSASPHPGGEHNVLSGHIDQVQYSGSEMHYWVRLGAHVIWRARVSNTADEKPFAVGQAVFLRFSAADAMTLVE
jgi:ABC-type Fe3+/spermidine/putrescine transport system ATPase subunit